MRCFHTADTDKTKLSCLVRVGDVKSALESNKVVFGPGAANPAEGADGAPSDPLVD